MSSATAPAAVFHIGQRRQLAVSVLLLTAAALAVLWPTCRTLIAEWGNTAQLTYTHGWLIALISLWLAWRACTARDFERVAISWLPIAALAFLSLLWLVSLRAGIELGHQVLLPILLWLAVRAAFGRTAGVALLFPLGYLYFAIPIWSLINSVLQHLTVGAVRVLLPVTGVSAYFQGNTVHIASGVFEIAGGCSGLHFFIVALAIAALYGELNRDPLKLRALLLLLACVLAVIANWLRVFTIIVAGYLTDMQHFLIRVDHYYFGWFVFAVAMFGFFLIARRLPASEEAGAPPAAMELRERRGTLRSAIGIFAALAALSVGPVWAFLQTASPGAAPAETQNAERGQSSEWQPIFVGADTVERSTHHAGDIQVESYIAEYRAQRQGKELIGYNNSVIGDSRATIIAHAVTETPQGSVRELVLKQPDGSSALLWYYYEVGASHVVWPAVAQLSYGIQSLTGAPRSRVVALRSACRSDCTGARTAIAEVMSRVAGSKRESE